MFFDTHGIVDGCILISCNPKTKETTSLQALLELPLRQSGAVLFGLIFISQSKVYPVSVSSCLLD